MLFIPGTGPFRPSRRHIAKLLETNPRRPALSGIWANIVGEGKPARASSAAQAGPRAGAAAAFAYSHLPPQQPLTTDHLQRSVAVQISSGGHQRRKSVLTPAPRGLV